jgi:RimJ/RimL family protein N-acetyltransferase
VVIRRQTPADVDALSAMLADADGGRPADRAEDAERVGLVAFEGERLVGHAALRRIGPYAAELAVEVAAGHRGRGVGTQLADAVVEAAREAGMEVLIADVRPDNAAMLKVLTATGVPLAVTDAGEHLLVELEL